MRIDFLSEREFLEALRDELAKIPNVNSSEILRAEDSVSDNLSLDLSDVAALATIMGLGLQVAMLAGALLQAQLRKRARVIEIRTPAGVVRIDMDGKSAQQLEAELKVALPFLT